MGRLMAPSLQPDCVGSIMSLGIFGTWTGRTLAGFAFAIVMAFIGDLGGRVVNLLLGYPWSQDVHFNLQLVSIGIATGIGANLGWISLRWNRYYTAAMWIVVCAAAVIGVYGAHNYGPGVSDGYWWSRFAMDTTIHITGAVCGTVVATVIGITQQAVAIRRAESHLKVTPMTTQPTPIGADEPTAYQ